MLVVPVYVLTPLIVQVPEPSLVSPPAPEMGSAMELFALVLVPLRGQSEAAIAEAGQRAAKVQRPGAVARERGRCAEGDPKVRVVECLGVRSVAHHSQRANRENLGAPARGAGECPSGSARVKLEAAHGNARGEFRIVGGGSGAELTILRGGRNRATHPTGPGV